MSCNFAKIIKDNAKIGLDFNELIKIDPSIKDKIKWVDPMANIIGDIDDILNRS